MKNIAYLNEIKELREQLPNRQAGEPFTLACASKEFLESFNGLVIAVAMDVIRNKGTIDEFTLKHTTDHPGLIIKLINKEGLDLFIKMIEASETTTIVSLKKYSHKYRDTILLPTYPDYTVSSISTQLKERGTHIGSAKTGFDPETLSTFYIDKNKDVYACALSQNFGSLIGFSNPLLKNTFAEIIKNQIIPVEYNEFQKLQKQGHKVCDKDDKIIEIELTHGNANDIAYAINCSSDMLLANATGKLTIILS